MFLRLICESFLRQKRRKLLAGAAILLGATAVTAMLTIGVSVGNKMSREMKAYGANIVVAPAADALDVEVGGVPLRPAHSGEYLKQSDLAKIKQIFWHNNIENISPELPLTAQIEIGQTIRQVPVVGYWFHHALDVGGESYTVGAIGLHPWWRLDGTWPRDGSRSEIAIGETLARRLQLQKGDRIEVEQTPVTISGIVSGGNAANRTLLVPLALAQQWLHRPGAVRRVYVSALTKPEDALGRSNPATLSPKMRERWYCSAYPNSIAYQIQQALPHSRAEQIRRIAQGEGKILSHISGLMWLVALAALVASGLAVAASMATAIAERHQEIGLMRALGASHGAIAGLFFTEVTLLAAAATIPGYFLGSFVADQVSQRIFGSGSGVIPALLPLTLLLIIGVSLIGGTPSILRAARTEPASVLRASV